MSEVFLVRRRGSRYFFTVRVFDTKHQMYKHFRAFDKEIGANDSKCNFDAICMCYERITTRGPERRMPDIGEVLFYRDRLGAGIVAHEMLHASLHYDRMINGNKEARFTSLIGDEEERLAHTLTDLVRQFTVKAYERGIYT